MKFTHVVDFYNQENGFKTPVALDGDKAYTFESLNRRVLKFVELDLSGKTPIKCENEVELEFKDKIAYGFTADGQTKLYTFGEMYNLLKGLDLSSFDEFTKYEAESLITDAKAKIRKKKALSMTKAQNMGSDLVQD